MSNGHYETELPEEGNENSMRRTYHFTRLLATAVIATLALLLGSPQFSFANNSWTGDHTTLRQEAAKLGIHVETP